MLAPHTATSKRLGYWDYDRDAPLTCPACGWVGRGAGNEDYFKELLDVRCPECDKMLLIVSFPTHEETRAAAAAGNPRAQAELPNVEAREAFLEQAREIELKEPSQLPPLEGKKLQIDWDFEERDEERWTVLKHRGREIWREVAYFEGYERFASVLAILQARYGSRLVALRPTPASEAYLYGDELSAPTKIARLNAELRKQ